MGRFMVRGTCVFSIRVSTTNGCLRPSTCKSGLNLYPNEMLSGPDASSRGMDAVVAAARKINKLVGRKGELLRGEPFGHLVRSVKQFEYLQRYIADNPRKAGLSVGEFSFYEKKIARRSPP